MSEKPILLITADTHAGGSHAQYREYLDPAWRAAFDEWRGGYRNPSAEHYGAKKKRNWDYGIRTADQESQGVVGEVIFPNTVPPFYRKSIVTAHPAKPEDYQRCLAGIRAHNRWLKDFCAEDPVRRAGIGLILPHDFDEAIKDIQYIAEAGLRGGVLLPLVPPDAHWLKPLYHPAWDRVFAAIQDHGLVMNQHTGQGLPDYGEGAVAESLWIQDVAYYGQAGWRHLLMAGVYEKFPKLKHILTESGCSWVPAALAQLDRTYDAFKAGSQGEMDYKGMDLPLKARPSEYAKRHCYYGASFPSKADLDGIDEIGEEHVLWGNDYPHYEGTFPYTLESLRLTFGDMPDSRRRKVLGLNAAALYNFDLEKLEPLAAKYGPKPAQIETPLPAEAIPRDSACYLFTNALKAA
ncbi:MAG TPA: amidohydrolase family protein [Alphaproteobacteria bacterium]|nr:amidohydrolase family protein [Alphaproteobacteria bacterium]